MRTWSSQQEKIFGWFEDDSMVPLGKNAVVRARAGTGKTTTIIEGVNRAPEQKILVCAFNKRIADELTTRLTNPRAQAKTLHSVGFAAVRRYRPRVVLLHGNERADWLAKEVCGEKAPDSFVRLCSKLHTKAREVMPHADEPNDVYDLMIDSELEPEEQWEKTEWNGERLCACTIQAMDLAASNQDRGIDFADMIFLPVRNGWLTKTYDLVVVDEAQDMNMAQLEIAQGVCKGRMCVVGDDRQAIYGFRGADSGSLDRLKKELNATEFGLTVTYRCGVSIVDKAREIVKDFQAGPTNGPGAIEHLFYDKLTERVELGDFVLSRLNAPLVTTAISFLKAGKRTRIAGKDIGASLVKLVRKLCKGRASNSIPELLAKIAVWEQKEVDRMIKAKREDRIDMVHDQASMLLELAQASSSVQDMENRIEALFTDDGLGQAGVVTCSSVHRSKGLEADRVFILTDTLRYHSIEEDNIRYVAITRAKNTLFMVNRPKES